MRQKLKYVILVCVLLSIAHLTESKRSYSGRSRTSSSSSRGSTRRTQTQTHYSPPPSGTISKPSTSHSSNAEHVKLSYGGGLNSQPNKPISAAQPSQNKPPSYGWNVAGQQPAQSVNKPPLNAGPPPAYSPHNVAGGGKTNINEPPPAYKPNNAPPPSYPGNNQQPASYPKQTYNTASGYPQQSGGAYPHNTGVGTGVHPVGHNTGYRPHNGTGGFGGGVHSPIYAHTVRPVAAGTYSQGAIQPGFYPHQTAGYHPPPPPGGFPAGVHPAPMPVGGYSGGGFPAGGFSYPQQSAPVYAGSGIQPGFYPAGSFPGRSSSGPGLGTGLIAGAIGGAILGHALTPTNNHHHVVAAAPAAAPASDGQDRIIIINNTPGQPATVTNAAGQPASGVNIIQNGGQPATNNMGTSGAPVEQPVPLAPFPNTPQQQQPLQSGVPPVNPSGGPIAGSTGTNPDGIVPLAPFPNTDTNTNTNTTGQPNANGTQPMYGTYCVPVMVNVTDPNNTANVTTVEQVYCYTVEYPPEQMAAANSTVPQQSQLQQQQQQPDLMHMPGNYNPPSNDISNIPTQKTSTASLADNTKIQSGVKGLQPILDTLLMGIVAFTASYYMH